jgi:hypothetical protein
LGTWYEDVFNRAFQELNPCWNIRNVELNPNKETPCNEKYFYAMSTYMWGRQLFLQFGYYKKYEICFNNTELMTLWNGKSNENAI